jgi:hypothetical protein
MQPTSAELAGVVIFAVQLVGELAQITPVVEQDVIAPPRVECMFTTAAWAADSAAV